MHGRGGHLRHLTEAVALAVVGAGIAGAVGARTAIASSCPPAPHHAAVVVEHSTFGMVIVCVGFSSNSISGDQLLNTSGIQHDYQGFGGLGQAVCQVDSEPSQVPANCFGTSKYWALFSSAQCGPWRQANVGINSLSFNDGDLEGFRYDPQSGSSSDDSPSGPAGYCPNAPPARPPSPVVPRSVPNSRAPASPAGIAAGPTATAQPSASSPGPGHAQAPPSPSGSATPTPAPAAAVGGGINRSGPRLVATPPASSRLGWLLFGGLVLLLLAALALQLRARSAPVRTSVE